MTVDWPSFGLQSDVRPLLAEALEAGARPVMVTLAAAEGAAPLGVGAQMLFAGEAASGFLSGGCVESDVRLHAQEALASGARRLVYGRGGPPDIQLLCGARIELLVEEVTPLAAERLIGLWRGRVPALWLSDGTRQLVLAEGDAPAWLPSPLRDALDAAEHSAIPAGLTESGAIYRRFDPQPRLVLVGGDPIALGAARLAVECGFETVLVRPKGPAAPPPAPGVLYRRDPPAQALAALGVDAWTAVAAASHDLDIDHETLAAALPSPALYVGALGSRRRLAERQARLRQDGVTEAELRRLRAPLGLEIGAKTPWEIAVSILGEVIAAFRAQDARRVWPAGARSQVD